MKRIRKTAALLLVLCLCAALPLSGCRDSAAISQYVWSHEQVPMVHNQSQTYDDNNEDPGNLSENNLREEAQEQVEDPVTTGQTGETENADQAAAPALNTEKELDSPWTVQLTPEESQRADHADSPLTGGSRGETTAPDSGSGGGAVDEDAPFTVPDGDTGIGVGGGDEHSGGSTQTGGEIQPDDGTDKDGEDGGGSDPDADKELVDPDGEKVTPVDNSGRVAAPGQLAILVSMLGGSDRLCAASEDYRANPLAQRAFASAAVPALWSGDGSRGITEESFQTLLDLHPGLVLELSGQGSLTGEQITRLEAAGIEYHAVPNFKTAESIESCVQVVADFLGDRSAAGGTDAPAIAQSYLKWCAAVEKDLAGAWTTSTVFIEDWDSQVQTVATAEDTGEVVWTDAGAAVIRGGDRGDPLNDYLALAQVTNYTEEPVASDSGRTLRGIFSSNLSGGQTPSGALCYLTPMFGTQGTGSAGLSITTLANMQEGIQELVLSAGIANHNFTFGGVWPLGRDTFPTVIAKTAAVKAAIESSDSWRNYYDPNASIIEGFGNAGRLNVYLGSDMYSLASGIMGDYTVYVNPAGLGDWVGGSPESILETVWAAWAVQNQGNASVGYTENGMKTKIRDFYSTFYHYNLSDAELSAILAGNPA